MTETTWQMFAACHPSQGHDPDLWFGPDTDDRGQGNSAATKARTREAKRICRGCPVRETCLTAGSGEWGVWGGMAERERRQANRVQPILRDICGTSTGYARHLDNGEHPCMACRWWRSQRVRAQREARRAG